MADQKDFQNSSGTQSNGSKGVLWIIIIAIVVIIALIKVAGVEATTWVLLLAYPSYLVIRAIENA